MPFFGFHESWADTPDNSNQDQKTYLILEWDTSLVGLPLPVLLYWSFFMMTMPMAMRIMTAWMRIMFLFIVIYFGFCVMMAFWLIRLVIVMMLHLLLIKFLIIQKQMSKHIFGVENWENIIFSHIVIDDCLLVFDLYINAKISGKKGPHPYP